jgi:GAF domain-containing protein
MLSEPMRAVLGLLGDAGEPDASVVCARAADVLGVDGVSAGLGTGPQGAVLAWGRDAAGVALEELEFTLGLGPGLEAVAQGVPVLVSDVETQASRWPGFAPGALDLKIRAVFAFPLRLGAISVGALTAHRAAPGPLADGQVADALALAEAVTVLLLDRASQGTSISAIASPSRPRPGWDQPPTYRAEVHQATGMISAQLGVSLAEALVRLRAHAYSQERTITDVAADVVGRRLRFESPQ